MVMDVEDKIIGDLEFLGRFIQLIRTSGCRVSDLLLNFSHVADSLDDVARARFALGADHGSAFADSPERFAQVLAPQTKGTLNFVLSIWYTSSAGERTSLSSM